MQNENQILNKQESQVFEWIHSNTWLSVFISGIHSAL